MLCRIADVFRFKIGTFQHVLEGYKVADEIAKHSLGGSCFSDWWAYKVEVQDAIPQDGPIMAEQGVCVSYNSDSDELARRLNVEAVQAKGALGADLFRDSLTAWSDFWMIPIRVWGAAAAAGQDDAP